MTDEIAVLDREANLRLFVEFIALCSLQNTCFLRMNYQNQLIFAKSLLIFLPLKPLSEISQVLSLKKRCEVIQGVSTSSVVKLSD